MEKTEILHNAQQLGKLLITVDETNATWHGMYADILIVKGIKQAQITSSLNPR